MANQLKISLGQYSDKGHKPCNQDFHGACIPQGLQLETKGVAIALADGISSSTVSHIASESAVKGFLTDYFSTPETWSIKTSAQRVLSATNSWLHAQTRQSQHRYDMDKGYVCTFSALVLRGSMAHIFHAGDARIYRLRDSALEQLTCDHRLWISQQSYLSRAMGASPQLELDYQTFEMDVHDVFLLATDGVHGHVNDRLMADILRQHEDDPDAAAKALVASALQHGSQDNLTVQIVRIDELAPKDAHGLRRQLAELPPAPELHARMQLDGFTIVRTLHASGRSHVYLAVDDDTGTPVALKALATETQHDPDHLERFLMEEWIARRLDSPHVLKPWPATRQRRYLYTVTEFVEGCTLTQWMRDHPRPDLHTVRAIVGQIAKGLRAFHQLEMLHQDLRPDNILIDATGTVKIIDFGSTRVAGLIDTTLPDSNPVPGTVQYAAPEYFLGEGGTHRSDLFSLGVIAYQMLTGRLPYGTEVAKAKSRAAQKKLTYDCALDYEREIPAWVDDVLRRAVHPEPDKRYQELSEFIFDLHNPPEQAVGRKRPALVERRPLALWQGLCGLQLVAIILLLMN